MLPAPIWPASATRLIGAKLSRRVHWLCCTLFHKYIMPRTVLFFKPLPQFHWLVWLYHSGDAPSKMLCFSSVVIFVMSKALNFVMSRAGRGTPIELAPFQPSSS